ncbi:MAG: H-NS histone family protein [Maritimibacter sp.]|nr:H-NS histone family protein [Maritimibacter sp.]
MKAELRQMSRKQLEKLRADVDAAIAKLDSQDKKAALKAAQEAAKKHGFSLAELTGEKPAAKPAAKPASQPRAKKNSDGRAKVAPKYKNPNNADETWSGRGRAPKWMTAHIAAGGNREDCAI